MYRRFFGAFRSGRMSELKEIKGFVFDALQFRWNEFGYNFLHSRCSAVRRPERQEVYLPWNASLTVVSSALKKEPDHTRSGSDHGAYGGSRLHAVSVAS
jgi:hypothetical protein